MRRFLRTARGRTLFGLTLAILFVPVMLGISACFGTRTPIGDPEQGWADPRISGAWLSGELLEQPEDYNAALWLFRPWDDKTWLLTVTWFSETNLPEASDEVSRPEDSTPMSEGTPDPTATDAESPSDDAADEEPFDITRLRMAPDEIVRILGTLTDDERTSSSEASVYKAWITSIGEYRFLVLEPVFELSTDAGFVPSQWVVLRIVLKESMIELDVLDTDRDELDEVTTRGEAEAIIVRHAADPEFVEPFYVLHPIPQSAYGAVAEAIEAAGLGSD